MSSKLHLDVGYATASKLWRRLENAYEVKADYVFAGKTVWSISERLRL